jgi:hypothetical protein
VVLQIVTISGDDLGLTGQPGFEVSAFIEQRVLDEANGAAEVGRQVYRPREDFLAVEEDSQSAVLKRLQKVVDGPDFGSQQCAWPILDEGIVQADQDRVVYLLEFMVGQLGTAVIVHQAPADGRPGLVELPDEDAAGLVFAAAEAWAFWVASMNWTRDVGALFSQGAA